MLIAAECGYQQQANENNSIDVVEYTDTTLEGSNITFSCPPGIVLTGPNKTMSMNIEQWEPDLSRVKCEGEYNTIFDISYGMFTSDSMSKAVFDSVVLPLQATLFTLHIIKLIV